MNTTKMVNTPIACLPARTEKDKSWDYDQYYLGEKDEYNRKDGQGEIHWTGAESLEWYIGSFICDTMHGKGDYRWRYCGVPGTFETYEGHFYANAMHGYGTLSYQDGKIFKGLFNNDYPYGPGIETHLSKQASVGLWNGYRLVRLAWKPPLAIVPDFMSTPVGVSYVESFRNMLATQLHIVGQVNPALEILKQYGADPCVAAQQWRRLYPKRCTDVDSTLFHRDVFDQKYYRGKIHSLEEIDVLPDINQESPNTNEVNDSDSAYTTTVYFAWNNNKTMKDMMCHCYKHEKQRNNFDLDLTAVLCGPRSRFYPPAEHEKNSRTLLMASYLGNVANVTQLVNNHDVHPDIADMQGNTALMYAVVNDQIDIVNFLIDAGATVDSYNDGCCTPLGIALIKFVAIQNDITMSKIVSAMLPPQMPIVQGSEQRVFEWKFVRDSPAPPQPVLTRRNSKTMGKAKSLISVKNERNASKGRISVLSELDTEITRDKSLFTITLQEYEAKVNSILLEIGGTTAYPYVFAISDMVREIETLEEESKKAAASSPKKNISKIIKEPIKRSKIMLHSAERIVSSNSIDERNYMLSKIQMTIDLLLTKGADPRNVICPQSALFMAAATAGSDELLKRLVEYGANINESYPMFFNYTVLDIAVSKPLTSKNLRIVKAILECGGNADHRLRYVDNNVASDPNVEIPGPTLLHAVLAKKLENEEDEELRAELLDLLLTYNCNANAMFKGRSAIDVAMTRKIDLLDTFIKNKKTNLNGIINENNQSILVKMFTAPFCSTIPAINKLQILTNLLLYGADPMLKCHNDEETYQNLFVYAAKVFNELENASTKTSAGKPDAKAKKEEANPVKGKEVKGKKTDIDKKTTVNRTAVDIVGDYRQCIDLVRECARMLRVRWIQAQLVKELIKCVDRYKHRSWHMIIKEHISQKQTRLWVTAQRCLEIWEILKTATKKKIYDDMKVLKMLLCIVHYYNIKHNLSLKLKMYEKERIETDMATLVREHVVSEILPELSWSREYVTPELTPKAEERKFNVCFECLLPFPEDPAPIPCCSCKLVSFCSMACMRASVRRGSCHELCGVYLTRKYFPTPEGSTEEVNAV